MKSTSIALALILSVIIVQAQEYQVVQRGAHHRVWEKPAAPGEQPESYTELATGLHYWERGQWKETKELIEIVNGVAVASQGPHRVIFAANANTANGAVDLLTPDGKRMRSIVVGLIYVDSETGASIPLAAIKNSEGAVLPPNQVYYLDAFDADGFVADLRYTYTRAGLEQDVILRAAPAPPGAYGLNPETTKLMVVTEFIEAPEPEVQRIVLRRDEPDFIDERLDFGMMKVGSGRAFSTGDTERSKSVRVAKDWTVVEGRTYLTEQVRYVSVERHLRGLPQAQARVDRPGAKVQSLAQAFPQRAAPGETKTIQVAAIDTIPKDGLVIDYTLQSSESAFRFEGNTTYFVTGPVTLSGTTTIEGGTVVKYTNYSAVPYLWVDGPIECEASMYLPAYFTAMRDDTVGTTIPGPSADPSTNCYAAYALVLASSTDAYTLRNIHIRFAETGVLPYYQDTTLENVQFGFCTNAFYNISVDVRIRNGLIFDCENAFVGNAQGTNYCEHVTFSQLDALTFGWGAGFTNKVYLTNCLIADVTGSLAFEGSNNATNTGGFATVGAGAHYTAGSYRNAGTTNISASLLEELKNRTTYPPQVLTDTVLLDTTLSPVVPRGIGPPGLGYAYAPIDFAINTLTVEDTKTVVLTNGVAVAVFGDSGFWLREGSTLRSFGSPTRPNHIVRYYAVQEQPVNWDNTSVTSVNNISVYESTSPPVVELVFTHSSIPANGGHHLYSNHDDGWKISNLSVRHSEFYGGNVALEDTADRPYTLLNNLFRRLSLSVFDSMDFTAYDNTFAYCSGNLISSATDWVFKDNLLSDCTIKNVVPSLAHDYNAFYNSTNSFCQYYGLAGYELVLSALSYDDGPLGKYYWNSSTPTVVDVGSRLASYAGLYHFTTTTNNVAETNSTVNIGYHYVALNGSLSPIDTDQDGIPDYFEDADGDGVVDTGERDWKIYESVFGVGSGPGLVVFTPLEE